MLKKSSRNILFTYSTPHVARDFTAAIVRAMGLFEKLDWGLLLPTCGISRVGLARRVKRRYDVTGAWRGIGVGILRDVWSYFCDYFLLVASDPINSESILVFAGVLP